MCFAIREKTILVDCDGVLLDWEYAFTAWMDRHGYKVDPEFKNEYLMNRKYGLEKTESKRLIRMFNESAWIRKLPPLRDAMKYVKKLHQEHGYVFHAITSLSNDQYAQHLRTKNLREMFGDTVFERYVYLDTGADKDEVLKDYANSNCFWVEDKPENALVGAGLGLDAILVNHHHNADFDDAKYNVTRIDTWKEIYDIVTG